MDCLYAAGESGAAVDHPSCTVFAAQHETQQRSENDGCDFCVVDREPARFRAAAPGHMRCRLRASADQTSVFLTVFASRHRRLCRDQPDQLERDDAACQCEQLWRGRDNEQCCYRVLGTVDPFLPCVPVDLELDDIHGRRCVSQCSVAICFGEQ